jgi:hypothetical protein
MRNIHFLFLGMALVAAAALYSFFANPLHTTAVRSETASVAAASVGAAAALPVATPQKIAASGDHFNFAVEHRPGPAGTGSLQAAFDAGQYDPALAADSLPKLTWQMLRDVKYKEKWNEAEQMHFNYPVFGAKVKALAGKEFYVTGYMIPLDAKGGLYAVSANPYAACYFCGQSGPETIVSIKFSKPPKRYKTDDIVNIRGTLRLNDTDVNDFIYVFERASDYDSQ